MNYCEDCKYLGHNKWLRVKSLQCTHPIVRKSKFAMWKNYYDCKEARQDELSCGKEGKYYE